jgi:tetratricopeptide (TPR) repeat protein
MRRLTSLLLTLFLALPAPLARAQVQDADVRKGITQVEDGDYDGAILTLDNAARRLAADKTGTNDLAQAYLHLGIAYIGKGREAAAKAKFREAIAQIKDLTLEAEKFPPKVVDLFEAAKSEAKSEAARAGGSPAPEAAPKPSPVKKGGSKAIFILGGVVVAGGVAAAAGGGGSKNSTTGTQSDTRSQLSFSGTLESYEFRGYQIAATKAGTLEARATWPDGQVEFILSCQEHDPPYTSCGTYNRASDTTGILTTPVTQKTYDIIVLNHALRPASFTMVVLFP